MDLSGPGIDVKLKERKKESPYPAPVLFLPTTLIMGVPYPG
jgi:hypothetical protein